MKKFLLIVFLIPVVIFCCKKDEEKDNAIKDDPRVRSMSISGISTTFVVNDAEGLIFNYDSISYGTAINKLRPAFSGYGEALSFQYRYDGDPVWKEYTNQDTLDFSSVRVFFKAIAPDPVYTKEYQIAVRVHKYDVEAFTWYEKGTLIPVQGKVISQKAILYNNKYYFFYCNNLGESYLLTSDAFKLTSEAPEDENSWIDKGKIDIDNPDWATLTSMYTPNILAVQAAGKIYRCDLTEGEISFLPDDAVLPENYTLHAPLFTLKNSFWIIVKQESTYRLCSLPEGEKIYKEGVVLPSGVQFENITTFVAPSGSAIIGYIFGEKHVNGNDGAVWGVDVSGNVMQLTSDRSVFSFRSYPMPFLFENRLCIFGGLKSDGYYSGEFFNSPNSGATWSKDTHKILPVKIGMAKGSIFEYERNKLIIIGGESKEGFLPNVWKGTLNQEILNGLIYN